MSQELDLQTASRETLLAIIGQQQESIAQLQQRIKDLEARLNTRSGPGMPGNKPTTTRRATRKAARRPRPHGFTRTRMTPTERVEHVVEICPDCGTQLVGGWVQRRREVIELAVPSVAVTEHVLLARVCPVCAERRIPKATVLRGVVAGQQRLGVNLVSLLVTLREEGRLPYRVIQWYLQTVHQLHLSVGAIVSAVQRAARAAEAPVAAVLEQIRGSPVVHADETGWREDGENGYVWTFSTPRERYFLRRGRDKGVVDEVLGDSFQGVLVSDFYAAYNHYPGLKQRCWAHLLREIHQLKRLYPADRKLGRWAAAVQQLYREAQALASLDPKQRRQAQGKLERKLLARCRSYLDDPLAVQGKLCRRIQRFIKELFVFVGDPAVPGDNNPAERSLRHLVTSRKISGGTRSRQGTESKMTLASLFGTWRAQDLNPFLQLRLLLASPHS